MTNDEKRKLIQQGKSFKEIMELEKKEKDQMKDFLGGMGLNGNKGAEDLSVQCSNDMKPSHNWRDLSRARYDPLAKLEAELAQAERDLDGLKLIAPTLVGDEIDEHARFVRQCENRIKTQKENILYRRNEANRHIIQKTLLEKARRAMTGESK